MYTTVASNKSSQLQRPRVDRFIPARESFTDERRRGPWRYSEFEEETVDIWDVKYQKQRNFRKYFSEAVGLKSVQYEDRIHNVQAWPCMPRKKRNMSSADKILDLPMYNDAPCKRYLFVNEGYCVCARQRLTSWHPKLCTWHQLGTAFGRIEQHDSFWYKHIAYTRCTCSKNLDDCDITTMDYSPTGNSFVTGCSRGFITSFDSRTLTINSWKRLHSYSIESVKISPDARYVAVLNSPLVQLLVWPSLESHSTVRWNWTIRTISWHPWRSALLGLGTMSKGPEATCEINMVNTPSSEIKVYKLGLNSHCTLDVMLFSHQTGELVLGVWNSNHSFISSKLLVMSDPSTVVDHSREGNHGQGRVRTMVFSPDGNKLATATADEELVIWDFLPEDKKNKKSRSRKFHALPVCLDQFDGGCTLR